MTLRLLALAAVAALVPNLGPLWRTSADSLATGAGGGAAAVFADPTALLDQRPGATLYGHSLRHMPGPLEVDQLDADPVVHVLSLFGVRLGLAFTVAGEYGYPALNQNDPKFPISRAAEGRLVGLLWAADLFGLRLGGGSWRSRFGSREGEEQVVAAGLALPFGGRVSAAGGWAEQPAERAGEALRWQAPLPFLGECHGETGAGYGCNGALGPLQVGVGRLWGLPTGGWSMALPFGLRAHLAWGKGLLPALLKTRSLPYMEDILTGAVGVN